MAEGIILAHLGPDDRLFIRKPDAGTQRSRRRAICQHRRGIRLGRLARLRFWERPQKQAHLPVRDAAAGFRHHLACPAAAEPGDDGIALTYNDKRRGCNNRAFCHCGRLSTIRSHVNPSVYLPQFYRLPVSPAHTVPCRQQTL